MRRLFERRAWTLVAAGLVAGLGVAAAAPSPSDPSPAIAPQAAAAHGPTFSPSAAGDLALGERRYQERCASCHDKPTDRTPSRAVLSKNPPNFIYQALTVGIMAPLSQGLSDEEKKAVASAISKVEPTRTAGGLDLNAIWGPSAASSPLDAPLCAAPPRPLDLSAPAWNGWSVKTDNARFQPAPGLSVREVPRLKVKWAFNYPGSKNGQATVVGDRLYVTSMSGAVYALDAKTGCVHWRHVAKAATRSSVTVVRLPAGGPARHALFFSDWTQSAVALNADTGEVLWKTKIEDVAGVQMTGAPTVHGRTLFVPISSGIEAFAADDNWECCRFRGSVVALDTVTGEVLWKTYTTAQAPKPFKKNRLGRDMWGPSGGAIWSAPTVDAKRGLIYVGTSNSYTDVPYDGSDAVMAMDMATGAVRWTNQLLKNDNYINGCWLNPQRTVPAANCPDPVGPDFSIGNSPILVDLPDGGQRLLVGQKSSHVYALDPARNGAVVWQRRLSPGSALGGVEFGMATDGRTLFAGISDVIAGDAGKPGLYALRVSDGTLLWSAPSPAQPVCRWKNRWCHGAVSQAVTLIPGVVFAGAYDGVFRAYDAATGKVIWSHDAGAKPIAALGGRSVYGGVFDGAGPTVAGGMVYVHSGYAGRSGESAGRDLTGRDGNVLIAYSVDGR